MDTNQPATVPSVQAADIGERIARMESKMDFVATREDIAFVRREIEATHTEIERTRSGIEGARSEMANLRADLLTEIANVQTVVANREASMQRWLLGITGTAMLGVTTALIRTFV